MGSVNILFVICYQTGTATSSPAHKTTTQIDKRYKQKEKPLQLWEMEFKPIFNDFRPQGH
jgi:hypothetical protein